MINKAKAQVAFGSSSAQKRLCSIDYLPETGPEEEKGQCNRVIRLKIGQDRPKTAGSKFYDRSTTLPGSMCEEDTSPKKLDQQTSFNQDTKPSNFNKEAKFSDPRFM